VSCRQQKEHLENGRALFDRKAAGRKREKSDLEITPSLRNQRGDAKPRKVLAVAECGEHI